MKLLDQNLAAYKEVDIIMMFMATAKGNQRLCEPIHSYYFRDEIEFLCVIALHGLFQFCLLLLKYMNVCSVIHCHEVHKSMLCARIFIIVG